MQTITELNPISLTVPFEQNGAAIDAVESVTWSLRNENGDVVASDKSTPAAGATNVLINIEGALNVALNDVITTYELTYEIATAVAKFGGAIQYQVEKVDALVKFKNTLVTPLQALSLVRVIPNVDSFSAAGRELRAAALLYAFSALAALKLNPMVVPEKYRYVDGKPISSISQLTVEAWAECDPAMLQNMSRAQMIEADYSLKSDEINMLREAGVQSYTVGEVKQFISSKRPAHIGMCPAAMRLVGRYLDLSRRVGRA